MEVVASYSSVVHNQALAQELSHSQGVNSDALVCFEHWKVRRNLKQNSIYFCNSRLEAENTYESRWNYVKGNPIKKFFVEK